MIITTVTVGELAANCYVVGCPETLSAVIIDPGAEPQRIAAAIKREKLRPVLVVDTHGHADHIAANDAFGVPVAIHRLDAPALTVAERNLSFLAGRPFACRPASRLLEDGETVEAGSVRLTVIHTPGGICLLSGKTLFSGDTLFCAGVGRTDFPGGDMQQLARSIRERLLVLPDATIVLPGHGPATRIGVERANLDWLL